MNNNASNAYGGSALFYLVNPPTGNNAISISLNSNTTYPLTAGAVTYSGVDLGIAYENFAATAAGSSTSPSVQVPSDEGDLVIGVVGGVSSSVYTLGGSGGTLEWSDRAGSGSSPMPGSGQSKPGDSPHVTLSWSGSANSWGAVGISLKAADPTKGYVAFSSPGSTSWTVPDGVTEVKVEAWGGGGGGGSNGRGGGGGGGGGAYAGETISVSPGQSISIAVGAGGSAGSTTGNGGAGSASSAAYNSTMVVSAGGGSGGNAGTAGAGGSGGTATVGSTRNSGGSGATGRSSTTRYSGGGGGSAGPGGNGTAASTYNGGDSLSVGGGNGADGISGADGTGSAGGAPGGGGSGGIRNSSYGNNSAGGAGADGQVVISYMINTTTSASFTQAPAFCSDFEMPQGGMLAATNYVEVAEGGSLDTSPDITAELSIGETVFATLEHPVATDLGDGIYALAWGDAVTSNITVTSGQAITWTLLNSSGASLSVLYGHEDYPSHVSLPTTTVISIDEFGIFEAPYPDTSAVGGSVAGDTVYVRAKVSDPFGAYDITGLDLSDQDGSIASLNDANVVAQGSCYKIYEYAWKPPREGLYEVSATAHEGSEGITDSRATPFDVTTLDLGTPCLLEFTSGNDGARTNLFEAGHNVCIRLTDYDQNKDPELAETVTVVLTGASGDTETLTLTETGPDTGVFTICVPSDDTNRGANEDGTIYGPTGTIYEVRYTDPDDPTDQCYDSARVPVEGDTPAIRLTKTVVEPARGWALVGETVSYRLTVLNTGGSVLSNIELTDEYPEELAFVSADTEQSSHDSVQRKLVWNNVGPLNPGESKRIVVEFAAIGVGDEVVNSAIADAGNDVTDEDDAEVKITQPRHTLTKVVVDNQSPYAYGDQVTYRIEIENTGSTTITKIPLEDSYSAVFLRFVSSDLAPDGTGGGQLFWENVAPAGGLAPSAKVTINLTFTVIGAANPVVNTARADYSEDEYGDAVPPVNDEAEITSAAGSISGHVINDLDRNGQKDQGEEGLTGVTVLLYADLDDSGVPVSSNLVAVTTTTGADGFYEFPNLPPGKYIVVEVDPTGYASSGDSSDGVPDGDNDNRIAIEVIGAGDYANNDFFDYLIPVAEYSSIGGTVWNDENRNGAHDGGEEGLPGVTVELYRDGRLVSETKTDSNGNYKFTALPPGNYTVVEKDPQGYESTGDVDGANDNRIDVEIEEAGQDITGRDFFDAELPARIYGYTFVDRDDSLTRTPADDALDGVRVELWQGGVSRGQTTTDANGYYEFDNLEPGDYEVRFYDAAGDLIDVPSSGTAAASNPERNRATEETGYAAALITLERGHGYGKDTGEPLNAGYDLPAEDPAVTIGSRIWLDENGDGVEDAGEDGIPNVVVELLDDENNVVATTVTDQNGNYLFTNIPAGDYKVRVDDTTLPTGLVAHPTYDEDGVGAGSTHTSVVPTLAAGDNHRTANFGYNWRDPADTGGDKGTGVIGDRIWVDANGDGVQDPGEPGMGGVKVTLLWDPDGDGVYDTPYTEGGYNPVAYTTPDGRYAFADLPPGSYVIEVNDGDAPEGYSPSGDPDHFGQELPAGKGDNRTTHPIILAPGDVFVNGDFGYIPEPGTAASIGNRVWFDADANGQQNDDEPGIAGVTVVLIEDTDGDGKWSPGESIIATTITDENGDYLFEGVPVGGNYLVWVNDADGILSDMWPTYDYDGGDNGFGLSAVQNLRSSGTTSHNFGYTAPGQTIETGLIGDTVFLDRDGDGKPSAGEGLEGVRVTLYKSDGQTVVATTVTDANGNYRFGGLKDGTYIVEVDESTLPGGGSGLVNSSDPDTPGSGDSKSSVTIRGGSIHMDEDFGYTPTQPNKINGTVWEDRNADGTQDNDEPNGIKGVTVELRDGDGKVIATTTTDENGDYTFDNVPDGTYYVKVTDKNNKLRGWWHKRGPEDGDDGNSQTQDGPGYEVTVQGGEDDETGDFGYHFAPAEIGNLVWDDANGNGIQDDGEVGIAGVPVTLTVTYPDRGDGPVVITVVTVTDENGNYSFGNLLLDEDHTGGGVNEPTYEISVTPPAGWTASRVEVGSDDEIDSMRTDKDGYYEFGDLGPGDYEVRFISAVEYVVDVPQDGDEAEYPERNRAALPPGDEPNYVSAFYTIVPGHGLLDDEGEPVNAGFRGNGPMSSGIDLRAYRGKGGVWVEYIAHDVEEDGVIELQLLGPDGTVLWRGYVNVAGGGDRAARFLVPGLQVGASYDFKVIDEVGKHWGASGVRVRPFAARMTAMTLNAVTLDFDTVAGATYEVQWVRKLGDQWAAIKQFEASGEASRVTVDLPEPDAQSGFFRIKAK